MTVRTTRDQWRSSWVRRQTTNPNLSIVTPRQLDTAYAATNPGQPTCTGVIVVNLDGTASCDHCDSTRTHRPDHVDLCTNGELTVAACVCRRCRPSRWNHPALS